MPFELVVEAGTVVLPDRVLPDGWLAVQGARIAAIGTGGGPPAERRVTARDQILAPGLVDIHVHGGGGYDFMDGTIRAIKGAGKAHLRHGTTSLVITTATAPHERILEVLGFAQRVVPPSRRPDYGGSPRYLGVHLYGPFFGPEAVGCHAAAYLVDPKGNEVDDYFRYNDVLVGVTIAPEREGWEVVAEKAAANGLRLHVGHSNATFAQFSAAVARGVTHVDHLFCAMSDKTKLRRNRPYPMQAGVLEGTLLLDHLTTEVIADGRHLAPELLQLAYKLKGPDRLALVTDCNRALDMPDGDYVFGGQDCGAPFVKRDGVGQMPDGSGLASSCVPLLHCARVFRDAVSCTLPELFRMAALTPARIVGWDHLVGSLEPGKVADFVLLTSALDLAAVYIAGRQVWPQDGP